MEEIIKKLIKFRDERDWKQFHSLSELARAIMIEAGELNDLVLFGRTPDEKKLKDELADILIYSLTLCHDLEFNYKQIILDKLAENAEKYPISKCKGKQTKYHEL